MLPYLPLMILGGLCGVHLLLVESTRLYARLWPGQPPELLEGGLRAGRRVVLWKDVKKVGFGPYGQVGLALSWRKIIWVGAWPEVFERALPALAEAWGDLKIPKPIRRLMDDPGLFHRISPRTAWPLLGLYLMLFVAAAAVRVLEVQWMFGLLLAWLLLGSLASMRFVISREQGFIAQCVILCGMFGLIAVVGYGLFGVPSMWDALLAGQAAPLLAAAGVARFGWRVGPRLTAFVLAGASLLPPAVWMLEAPYRLERRDLSHLTAQEPMMGMMTWSEDGQYAAEIFFDQQKARQVAEEFGKSPPPGPQAQVLLDLHEGRGIPLPAREGSVLVLGIRGGVMARRVTVGDKKTLYAKLVPDGAELEIASSQDLVARPGCLSPEGLICWQESKAKGQDLPLRLHDVRSGRTDSLTVPAPTGETVWKACDGRIVQRWPCWRSVQSTPIPIHRRRCTWCVCGSNGAIYGCPSRPGPAAKRCWAGKSRPTPSTPSPADPADRPST